MGFLNLFRRKDTSTDDKHSRTPRSYTPPQRPPYEIFRDPQDDETYQVTCFDNTYKVGRYYDVTRFRVLPETLLVNGVRLNRCQVSWYSQTDCSRQNTQTGKLEIPRASDYTDFVTLVDFDRLADDDSYCEILMLYLLEKIRVDNYLRRGLQDYPEEDPCGDYIGHIELDDKTGQYIKYFDTTIGSARHFCPEMRSLRQRVNQEEAKRRETEAKRRELQRQLDELNGHSWQEL